MASFAKITDWTFIISATNQVINYRLRPSLSLFEAILASSVVVAYEMKITDVLFPSRGGYGNCLGNSLPTLSRK